MKKIVSMLLLMSVVFTMFASVGHAASPAPKLFLNGTELISDVEPRIIKGSTLVPMAILSEGLGYEVEWEPEQKRVTVKNDSTEIILTIDQTEVLVNGQVRHMDMKAQLINWRTMVPVRFVGELLGLEFEWKSVEREVHMYRAEVEPEPTPEPTPTPTPEPGKPGSEVGVIKSVTLEENSVIKVTYEGFIKANSPILLDGGRRIVFDFPSTSFTPEILAQMNGQIETIVEDNPHLQTFRYSLFSTTPMTARLVLIVGEETGYVMTESEGEIRFALMPISEVPGKVPPIEENVGGKIYNVVIDAGHGAKDPGTQSKSLNKWEKEFNLSIALKIQKLLEADGRIKAHLTRSDDTFVELVDRVKYAENLKADLFISIHANSFENTSVTGTETYYTRENSKEFANVIHKHLLKATGLKDRGVRKANYKVTKDTTMPAILLESGYLSNTNDSKVLFSDSVQNRIAEEVVAGIKEYLNLK